MPVSLVNSHSLYHIRGADAESFLQGQLTNDVTLLDGRWQFSGYCNPQGRLLGLLKLWRHADGFFALVHHSVADGLARRLKMYVLRSKVEISPMPQAKVFAAFNHEGGDLQTELSLASGGKVTLSTGGEENFSAQEISGITALNVMGAMLVVDPDATIDIQEDYQSNTNAQRWAEFQILRGLPDIEAATAEQFVPQMVNLDALNGISFKKGCYTGQEIVARMHYLGKLKQRMYVCTVDSAKTITTGSKVTSTAGASAGITVSDSVSGNVLVVLRVAMLEEELEIENVSDLRVNASQPYAFPAAKNEA